MYTLRKIWRTLRPEVLTPGDPVRLQRPQVSPLSFPPTGPIKSERGTASSVVIGNSLPKSGTHLFNQLVAHLGQRFGGWANLDLHLNINGYRLKNPNSQGLVPADPLDVVRRLLPGQLATAHLSYHQGVDAYLNGGDADPPVRHFFLIRDPRDLIVSWMRFATYSERYGRQAMHRPIQEHLQKHCADDAERLHFAIREQAVFPYHHYRAWMDSPATRVVRFEQLHAAVEAAGRDERTPLMADLLRDLDIDADAVDLPAIHAAVFGRSVTSMRDRFGPSRFEEAFDDSHHAAIDTPEWREKVEAFGYTW